jgi:phytol kinase
VWLDPLFENSFLQDIVATLITFGIALAWLRGMDYLAHKGRLEARLSRKIIHIGTGPLFVLCWNFFSPDPQARYLAALVPLAITFQFVMVGLGIIDDPAAVKAMTRTGNRREILRGPLIYGLVFVFCTLVFWRPEPAGLVALMLLCGGDGLADIIGRRWGKVKLPYSDRKSWVGSAAMLIGGYSFALGFVWLFNALGTYQPPLEFGHIAAAIAIIALVAMVVEALPIKDFDNLTISATALLLGIWLL